MKTPVSTVKHSAESETTFFTKLDSTLAVGGCLFGECRDEKKAVPKIAAGSSTSLTDSSLVGPNPNRPLYGECEDNTPDRCGSQSSFNRIIDRIEKLKVGLENIERSILNGVNVSTTMEQNRLQRPSFRSPNSKPQPPPKLSLAPTFQLTKLTKVRGTPLSPLPASLPCSPVPSRSPVKLKPELPYQFNKRDEKANETGELEEIRSILSGLDLNKYKRRKGPEGCADAKPEKPNYCRSVSDAFIASSTGQCATPPSRTKLRELTEMLSKRLGQNCTAKGDDRANKGAFLTGKSSLDRALTFNKRSISVPGSAGENASSISEDLRATKLQLLTGSATLPRRSAPPPSSQPLSPKNYNISTLNALSLATYVAVTSNEATQSTETKTCSGTIFPLPPPKIKETDVTATTTTIRQNNPVEIKVFTPMKRQIAVKPLNFIFGDGGVDPSKKLPFNGRFSITAPLKTVGDLQKPTASTNDSLSLVPLSPLLSKPSMLAMVKPAESSTREDRNGNQQRRYFKKKLRGPYGQMLEEEMKKYENRPKSNHSREFEMVRELCQLQDDTQGSLYSSDHSLDEARIDTSRDECRKRKTSDPSSEARKNLPEDVSEHNLNGRSNGLTNKALITKESPSDEDTRTHIVRELHGTEKSYVESLEILVNKYMKALKCADYVDASLVDEIFYQVPRILEHHVKFLETLEQRIDSWHSTQTVGDIFTQTFSQKNLIEIYIAFINNWKSAKERIKAAVHLKPAFGRFLEHMSREHKGKLTIDALLIMPVQRIPRYELLIKELLKNTSSDHPDHPLLSLAQREVHDLAMKINHVERETVKLEQTFQKLREIDNLIDGPTDLLHPERTFICYALVTIPVGFGIKKDRGLFLFSDLLLITSIKRKSSTGRKSSSPTNNPTSFGSLEANKYKLLTKISLENLDIVKNIACESLERKVLSDIDHLEEDLAILGQISDLLSTVTIQHQILDEALQELQSSVSKQLVEKQTGDTQLLTVELNATTAEGVEKITIIFPTCEKRISWENSFIETKQKYTSLSKKSLVPEFLYCLPVRKTRAGLQFTCAIPTQGTNQYGYKDVWVCNSDGYVGQVCILTLQPEPNITSCNGICNSRILCIVSAPEYTLPFHENCYNSVALGSPTLTEIDGGCKRDSWRKMNNTKIQLESESSEDDEDNLDTNDRPLKENYGALCIKEYSDKENHQSTMWLGTEDGCILVYSCNENIRIKKTKTKIQLSSPVCCIMYLDDQIFASLASGELVVYSRKQDGIWNFEEYAKFSLGSDMCPINQMLAVNGKLWCGYQNYIKVLNCDTLKVEHTFQVSNDLSRSIIAMVLSSLGVWIALKYSPIVLLYHATTYEYLLDVSVVPAVSKILAGCDDIIQQHKSACLRITSLLTCKDLLWIGTSAGVVLTMPLSSVTTMFNCTDNINIYGVPQGHTGHVRFLTCVDTSLEQHDGSDDVSHTYNSSDTIAESSSNKILVISGGDGYEDFQNGYREAAGHDDSTNHLLLWHI